MNFPRKSNSSLHINTDPTEIYTYHAENPFPSPSSPKPVWRNQCQLTKPVGNKITPKSWESIKSPAAAFLSGFASSPLEDTEEEGDEIDNYVLDKVIGYGGFSVVRKGFRISDGQKVAVKVVQKTEDSSLERELDIWRSLDHKHIVNLEKVLETDSAFYIVCDFCENGSLLDRLQRPISAEEASVFFGQLCDALQYLHQEMRICHKDLKLENVLLDENNSIKLCDFGLAMHEQPIIQANPMLAGGSLPYVAPEQIKSSTAIGCPSTDIWSLGVILYALTVGKLPFSDDYDLRLQQKIISGVYDMPESLSSSLQGLLRACLQLDPQQRLTIQQIRDSSWLKKNL
ncbi:unnamed protein product [Rhizopus stolonifer]